MKSPEFKINSKVIHRFHSTGYKVGIVREVIKTHNGCFLRVDDDDRLVPGRRVHLVEEPSTALANRSIA